MKLKKAKFIKSATKELGLLNVVVFGKRSEEIKIKKGVGAIVCRAIGSLDYFIEKTENNKTSLKISLKYYEGDPVIKEIKRISKPGRRVYSRATSITKVMNGLGLAILSTPKGVMSDADARKNNIGGEIIYRIF